MKLLSTFTENEQPVIRTTDTKVRYVWLQLFSKTLSTSERPGLSLRNVQFEGYVEGVAFNKPEHKAELKETFAAWRPRFSYQDGPFQHWLRCLLVPTTP